MNLYQPAAAAAVVTETMGETEIIIIGNSIFVIPFTELHKEHFQKRKLSTDIPTLFISRLLLVWHVRLY